MSTAGRAAESGRPLGDRRTRRRQETITEICEVALEVMGEEGVPALSLAEVARRMGIRPPSLYQYFPSKTALYDALFGEGNRRLLATFREGAASDDPLRTLRVGVELVCAWLLDHPVLAQLLVWRPVPGFVPTAEAYAPAVELRTELRATLAAAVAAGQLGAAADSDEALRLLTSLVTGALSQQLANAPAATYEDGQYAGLVPELIEMFVARYSPKGAPS